jgi:predicted nucleotidyltransferase
MKTLHEIKSILEKEKINLFQKYPIKSLGIFGSYVRDEQTSLSGMDLLVEFDDKIGSRFIDLAEELVDLLGVKVDLVSRNGIKEKYFQAIKEDLAYV